MKISVGEASITARVYGDGAMTLVLAHGAGSDQDHPLLVALAEGLAARGIEVVTFNFLYSEAGRGAPNRPPVLEACWRAVLDAVRARRPGPVAIGGKSMGGRIASMVAAAGAGELAGVVLVGYPLHPPQKPEQLRVAHLPSVTAPMLFVQGERDEFGTPDELRPFLAPIAHAELFVVAGGDHSLRVPRRGNLPQAEVDAAVQQKIADWLSARRVDR